MHLLVGTRKGLFTLVPRGDTWTVDSVDFLGEPVTAAVVGHDGTTFAALGTGHFGSHWRYDELGAYCQWWTPRQHGRPKGVASSMSPDGSKDYVRPLAREKDTHVGRTRWVRC